MAVAHVCLVRPKMSVRCLFLSLLFGILAFGTVAAFWIFTLVTGGRPKWGQEGFSSPALYTVVVSPQWTVSRVMPGWQQ